MEKTGLMGKTMLVALAALASIAVLSAYMASLFAPDSEYRNLLGLTNWAVGFLIVSFGLGSILVVLYGVPLFVLLASRGSARWPYVLLIGIAPGLVVALWLGWTLGYPIIGFGLAVSAVVRLVVGPGPKINATS